MSGTLLEFGDSCSSHETHILGVFWVPTVFPTSTSLRSLQAPSVSWEAALYGLHQFASPSGLCVGQGNEEHDQKEQWVEEGSEVGVVVPPTPSGLDPSPCQTASPVNYS